MIPPARAVFHRQSTATDFISKPSTQEGMYHADHPPSHKPTQTENNEPSLNRPRASGRSRHLNPAASRRACPHRQRKNPEKRKISTGESTGPSRARKKQKEHTKRRWERGQPESLAYDALDRPHAETGLEGWHGKQTGKAARKSKTDREDTRSKAADTE